MNLRTTLVLPALLLAALTALGGLPGCSKDPAPEPPPPSVAVTSLPGHEGLAPDNTPKRGPRMVGVEPYLRTYLTLFGGLSPLATQSVARGGDAAALFDTWSDYLGSLGLPDYTLDIPRAEGTNALMLATFERTGLALCDRAVEHDLRGAPLAQRTVFAFDGPTDPVDRAGFDASFDVLHRTFLGYPARLALEDRSGKFFQLYKDGVARRQSAASSRFSPSEAGWALVCYALVRHPEFQLY